MDTVKGIISAIGEDAICQRLGVKKDAIKKVRSNDIIPCPWYAALCEMSGVDLPRELFTFKAYAA